MYYRECSCVCAFFGLRQRLAAPGARPRKSSQLTHSPLLPYIATGSRGMSRGRAPEDAQRLYAEDVSGGASYTSSELPRLCFRSLRSRRMYRFASAYILNARTRCGFPGGRGVPRNSSQSTHAPRSS